MNNRPPIPTQSECDRLIREMAMLDHIVSHSRLVCRVALLLTDHLLALARRPSLNRELVRASALLHDITKTRSFKTKERHAQSGEIFLREKGFPEVGKIVGQHVCLDQFSEQAPLTEAEIVNYADKRVLHDQVASLYDRMSYIRDRYCKTDEHLEKMRCLWEESLALERKIFRLLPFGPEEVEENLNCDSRD